MTDAVLRLTGISRAFGALKANDGIDLALHRGEVVALLGENGAGKTTLMNILFGHYVADAGTIAVNGLPLPAGNPRAAIAAGLGMVHQHFTLADQMSVLDNIELGRRPLWHLTLGPKAARARLRRLMDDFGLAVNPDARVCDLSVGERQRVEILKALSRNAKILILDEPTAVLAPQEAEGLFATLRRMVGQGLSVIFISHKLHEVMRVADRAVVLRHGRVAGQAAIADTTPAALAALMVGGSIAQPRITPGIPGPVRLRLSRVTTRGAVALREVTLDLHAGQITGIAGVSGNGQPALFDLIAGLSRPAGGTMQVDGQPAPDWSPRAALAAGIARVPEDRHTTGSIADMTLRENAILERFDLPPFSRRGWLNPGAARTFTEAVIADTDLRGAGPEGRMGLLSGGNMQKLILGRALANAPKVILANQPVRGLDVGAIAYVHGRLLAARDSGAAVLLMSEDLDEIMALSDVLHVIYEGRLSPPHPRGTLTVGQVGLLMAGHRDAA